METCGATVDELMACTQARGHEGQHAGVCDASAPGGADFCQLGRGHDGWHVYADADHRLEWGSS